MLTLSERLATPKTLWHKLKKYNLTGEIDGVDHRQQAKEPAQD